MDKIESQNNRLQGLSDNATNNYISNKADFLKLNLYQIYNNLIINLVDILEDFLQLGIMDLNETLPHKIIKILSKKDRPIYVGIFMMILSLIFYFVELTN